MFVLTGIKLHDEYDKMGIGLSHLIICERMRMWFLKNDGI